MPFYESVYIARADVSAAQVEAITQRLTEIIEANGGKITKNEYWGLKNLAYRIKKNRKGHYALMNIDAPSAAVAELERNMRLNEDVLRYLTVKVDALNENPSAMMTSRGGRDDRGRGRGFGGRDDRGRDDRGRDDRGRDDRGRDDRGSRASESRAQAADAPSGPSRTEGAETAKKEADE